MFWYNINAKEDYINIASVASGNKLPSGKVLKKSGFIIRCLAVPQPTLGHFQKELNRQISLSKPMQQKQKQKTNWKKLIGAN